MVYKSIVTMIFCMLFATSSFAEEKSVKKSIVYAKCVNQFNEVIHESETSFGYLQYLPEINKNYTIIYTAIAENSVIASYVIIPDVFPCVIKITHTNLK